MSVTFKKSYLNPYKFRQYTNSSKDLYDLQMTNVMDSFFDSAMTNVSNGNFKAVVLSGIRTEAGNGEGTDANDASIAGSYINVVVKPLTPFGDMIPDPRAYGTPEEINSVIEMYASMYTARSDHYFDITNPVSFGQVIDCYFEKGSVSNSDFRTLRFAKPVGFDVDQTFESLATIIGVQLASAADWSMSSLLGSALDAAASYAGIGAEHLGAAESNFADKKFGPGEDGALRKKAWEALRPFLPAGTSLTSVYRSQADQEAIIKKYAIKKGFPGNTSDYGAMHSFLRKKPYPNFIVGRRVGRGHGGVGRTGALDLSGPPLDLIWAGVEAANIALAGQVKFAKLKQASGYSSIIERNNNCVHVHFNLDDINIQPTTAELQKKYDGKTMYFVPGEVGAKTGEFVTENEQIYFRWTDDAGENKTTRVFE